MAIKLVRTLLLAALPLLQGGNAPAAPPTPQPEYIPYECFSTPERDSERCRRLLAQAMPSAPPPRRLSLPTPPQLGAAAALVALLAIGLTFPRRPNLRAALVNLSRMEWARLRRRDPAAVPKLPYWRRTRLEGLTWPKIYVRRDNRVCIRARHLSPHSLKVRYLESMAAAWILLALGILYVFQTGPGGFHIKQVHTTEVLVALAFALTIFALLGVKLFYPLLKHWRRRTTIHLTPDKIRTDRTGWPKTYTIHSRPDFAVDDHPDAPREGLKDVRRQEKLRREGKQDTSEIPPDLREKYRRSVQVVMHLQRRDRYPLADIFFEEPKATVLRNVLDEMTMRLLRGDFAPEPEPSVAIHIQPYRI